MAAAAGRILIVDDEVGLMTTLQESLAQQGYETAGAQSAQDALRLLKEQEFDLLLCDLMMPDMDGITLLFEAQAQDPDLAGIVMTGQATIQTAVDAMKIGAYDYVLKPFKLSALLPILERALQVRRLRMAHEELQIRARRQAADIMDRKQAEEERERLLAELQVAHKRQILLSRQLLEAHESERRDVARDLHDDIGQMLIALKMNLQCADAASVPTEKRTTALSESLQLADRLIHEVRELALSLRPPLLDELGLAPALKAFAERQIQRAGLQLDFAADPLDPAPDANLATACFRVAQEAMSNAIRHARAGTLTVRLRRRDTNLELLVRDDGAGFDVPIARGEAGRGLSMGLLSMEERVRLLGGQIAITSAPGQGTEICASFPLHRPPQPLEESPSS